MKGPLIAFPLTICLFRMRVTRVNWWSLCLCEQGGEPISPKLNKFNQTVLKVVVSFWLKNEGD